MTKRTGKPTKIAIFGHFDGTNFGNEATLQAALYNLRRIRPDAEVTCICTGPKTVASTHQIKAIPITRTYLGPWAPKNLLSRIVRNFCVGVAEPIRWLEAAATLRSTEVLVIPGTGLLTDAYGLTGWGPYSLFRWAAVAKICRCRLAFISVGAGPFYTATGKFCVRRFLSLADFRSYRDQGSVLCLQAIGVSVDGDRLFPDLAFSLPKATPLPALSSIGPGGVIGLGVMEHPGRYGNQSPGDAAQASYLQALAETAKWLLARGYNIRVLIGDLADIPAKQTFLQLLAQDPRSKDRGRIIDEPIHSFQDLLSQIAETDVVVGTRFHNILLSFLCEKPVISISFHHKCEALMAAMGMSDYCLNIGDVEADRLIAMFRRLELHADALKSLIKERNKEFRDALDQQYKFVLNEMQSGRSATSTAAALLERAHEALGEGER